MHPTMKPIRRKLRQYINEGITSAEEEIRQRDLRLIDRPMKRSQVADLIGVSRSTVSRWDARCRTILQWHDYIRDHHEKYLKLFREGVA